MEIRGWKKPTVEATFREMRRLQSYLFCPLDSGIFGASDFQSVAAYFDVTRGPSEPTPQQVGGGFRLRTPEHTQDHNHETT